jgi:2-polyprenyl-3-methyl-5-hydroxy-6-metoxy-1,4-benzoquinol methylase
MSNYLKHMEGLGNSTAFTRRASYLSHNYKKYLDYLQQVNGSVLEIGPGSGELPSILNERGLTKIDLIDNDSSVLAHCQKSYNINQIIKTKGDNPAKYLKAKYNLIVLTQVFEHIPKSEYLSWIRGLYDHLKPGGHIIITVPNGANPLSGTERYGDLQHENIFTVFSFRELMTFANLKNAKYIIKGFEIPPSNLLNLIRIFLQKILHSIFILLMMINGAIYQTLMTPNITLVITRDK